MAKKRKAASQATKKDPYSMDELLTSEKSKLIDIDLHGALASFFSDPRNWAELPQAEKDYIYSLLPPHVELNDDGSVPTEFWKYNSEFRLDCRNLQEDLRAGRMDPEWQRQAAQAMEERAAGKFDDFKEKEYEEFWGQKQKISWDALAGHASKVRLEELLREGVFKVGDTWAFDHTFGRKDDTVRVEKECKIVKIDDKSVTLAIPPGQLKFARRIEHGNLSEGRNPIQTRKSTDMSGLTTTVAQNLDVGDATAMNARIHPEGDSTRNNNEIGKIEPGASTIQEAGMTLRADHTQQELPASSSDDLESSKIQPEPVVENSTSQPRLNASGTSSRLSSLASSPKDPENLTTSADDELSQIIAATEYDVILWEITGLFALERKILEVDGRAKSGSRTGSTWRDIRCRRNEQDMGSLFEMREEYYAYKVAKGSYQYEKRSK
ncbi:MAG: hypothetical protein Q9219_001566 [cf. Caloplaca sp. 3 TL-2023]